MYTNRAYQRAIDHVVSASDAAINNNVTHDIRYQFPFAYALPRETDL